MGISMNGPSGINTASLIDQLVSLEQTKITAVQTKIDDYQVKIDAYSKLKGYINALGTSALSLNNDEDFNLFTASSSDEDIVTLSAGVGAVEGAYDISVFQIASSEKMISTDSLINSQSASLSSLGITPGDISINGVSITIDNDDTIQDLRMKINNAVTSEGDKIGVTATVLKVSDTNYRLLLTSSEKGDEGAEYEDISGSVLQDLGIITDAIGTKGNTYQKLESDIDLLAAFNALAVGETVEFGGMDRNGNAISGMFIKGASSSIDDLISEINDTFHGMADVSVDGVSGKLVMVDKTAGSSRLSVSSFSAGATAVDMNITEAGREGAGVLTAGRDSFYAVDGILMQADTDSPEGVIADVTLELHKAVVGDTVRVEMSRNFDGITEKVKDFFNNYNAIVRYVNEQTVYNVKENDDDRTVITKGDLAADMTVRNIVGQIRSVFQQQFSTTGGSFNNLALIGISTDTKTGELKIDEDEFEDALKEDFNGVMGLFSTRGYSENANISLGRFTTDTTGGRYEIEELDPEHLRIRLDGETEWFTSNARVGDVVTFGDGPAKGLSVAAASGVIGAGEYFTFSKGIADQIQEMSNELTDGRDGLIALRQETWNGSIDRSEERILRLEASIEDYRLRLIKQFSKMEQNLNTLQSQSSNMMSALGYS
jgi:flagellar capping protein FliD